MMNKIFSDLHDNIRNIYSGSNLITINKFFHHSLNYSDMTELYSKYKGDVAKIKTALFSYINQYESVKSTSRKRGQTQNAFFDPILDDFFQNSSPFSYESERSDRVYQDEDVQRLYGVAQDFEVKKIQRKAQETGNVSMPADISISSFLRAIVEFSKGNRKYAYLQKMIRESGFDVEKFVKDDDLGKSRNKKLIDEHCTNLNKKALDGKLLPVIGRELEIEQVVNILKKARKNNPVLVGKAGVGKTAIVEGLAKCIVEKKVPAALENAVVYELRVMDLVKGTSFRGQFEQKMSDLLEEFKDLEASGELPILFIDELHTIMGAGSGGQGGLDFSNIIKPALARGELRTIGATTTDEWYKFIKENPALDRRFVSVTVNEPSVEDSKKIIEGSLSFYEKSHNVKYQPGSVDRAIELSQQFVVDNALPDKAFDLIDYAGARSAVNNKNTVSVEDIEQALSLHKNINIDAITETRQGNLEPLAPKIKKVLFGQDQAVDKVARTVEKAMAGLNAKDKPYGAFLFVGPTGTGKTELAKQIAKAMKGSFYRIDMSEFQEQHSVSKLLGSPAGYVGHDSGSPLTKFINENPRTVLLLDEIEKAHPDVYKLFLQVMDYGKLTDSKGKEINFRNVLLIMTSNAGTHSGKRGLGLGANNKELVVDNSEISKVFSPEFRARLTGNGPIEFNPLTKDLMIRIVKKYIEEIQEERLNKLKIKLKLSSDVQDKIAELGLSRNLGARPVKDFIENEIVEPLSDLILFGNLKGLKREKTVQVVLDKGKISLIS